MLQSDSTMLVVGEGVNAPQRTPCFTSRSISELKLMCFGQKWLIEVLPCYSQGSHALSQDGGSDCISPTYIFIQFVSKRFFDNHTCFELLNVGS